MYRDEALRVLGLEEGASEEDIKLAYKEMAQILHPDKFNANQKLKDRATEQFKQVNEAREILLSNKGRRGSGQQRATTAGSTYAQGRRSHNNRAAVLEARLNGIAAARVQLVAQRDAEEDSRKIGLIMLAGGVIAAAIGRRMPALLAVSSTALIWGIIKIINAQATIRTMNKHLTQLDEQKKACLEELDSL